ncbi:MAG: hypothetical protein KF869_00560 [Phycisphaeraceae bacterium]|nr:hypothetical protein [Phycisphaeraceae bacterium]
MASGLSIGQLAAVAAACLPIPAEGATQPDVQPPSETAQANPVQLPPRDFPLPPPEWKVSLSPRLWWTSPSGELKLPAASGTGPGAFTDSGDSVDISQLNLDTPRLSPAGELHIATGRWRFAFSAGAFSLDREATIADSAFRAGSVEISPGDQMSVRFDYSVFEATAGYQVYSWDFDSASRSPANAADTGMRLIALGGVRLHDVDIDLRSRDDGSSASTDQTFLEPIGGIRAEFALTQQFAIELQATGGAWIESDRSVYSLDLCVVVRWMPTPGIGVEFGWRQIAFSLSDGDGAGEFEYFGAIAGVFAGVTIRF